jgi:glucosamine kinase
MSDEALVMGVDVGGTSTRVLVASLDGEPRGRGRAAGGNPTAWPADQAAAALASAVSDALQGVDPAAVQALVLGVAGSSALDDPATAEHFDRVWKQSGVGCVPRVVGDLEIAFASATPEPDGTVVVSGTGAAAATIRDHTMSRSADGYGWLLGDVGSGYWLGREAVRHTLARLDGRLPPTVLSEGVLTAVLGADRAGSGTGLVRDLVRTVNSRQPVKLAELARVVEESADQGDTEAVEIIEQASVELIHTIERVRERADASPLVMVGGVLRSGSPVSRSLRTHLAERFAGPVLAATDGVVGATWLAVRSITKDERRELASHQRLTLG